MSAFGSLVPVVLFAYARLDHLRQAVDSLLANRESSETSLYVFCDGPRNEGHKAQTDAVRAYVDTIDGFASVTRVYRDKNLGLARSIISGVSEVLTAHDSVIVMEDDLVVSPYFLKFMNDGLSLYANEERVASIHAYCYPVSESLPETFFIRGADCWGWATWRRAWQYFEPDGQKLLDELRRQRLKQAFDLDGAYSYTRMLAGQVAGANDSWAVRWHASCFLKNMLTLYPGRSLVNNIGMDDSGTHCSVTDAYVQTITSSPVRVHPIPIVESASARRAISEYFNKNHSLRARLVQKIRLFMSSK